MILAREAMLRALTEYGYNTTIYRLCEHAYATGVDLVDFDALVKDVLAGKATEPPPLHLHELEGGFGR